MQQHQVVLMHNIDPSIKQHWKKFATVYMFGCAALSKLHSKSVSKKWYFMGRHTNSNCFV